LCFHDLRHFFVTELFRRGVSAPAVQRLAGHAEMSTTQRYADMTAEDLRAAILLLGRSSSTCWRRKQRRGNGRRRRVIALKELQET
jgi:hypothetical protein